METPKRVDFVVKRYAVRKAKLHSMQALKKVRSTQGWRSTFFNDEYIFIQSHFIVHFM